MKKSTSALPFLAFLLAVAAFFSACMTRHYAPNQLNINGFREKGEARAALAHSNGLDFSGADAQGAWAPLEHASISGDFFYGKAARNQKAGGWGQGRHANLAIGTFWKLGDRGSIEGNYGWGIGHVENWSRNGDGTDFIRTYEFQRAFGQVSYTLRHRNFEIGVGSRVVGLQHYNRKDAGAPVPGVVGWNYLVEPGVNLALGGGERFKLTVTFCRSYDLIPDNVFLHTENVNFGIGAQYRLGKLAKFPQAEIKEKKAAEAQIEQKTREIEQVQIEKKTRREDAAIDTARVLVKRFLKTGGTTDAPETVEKMKKSLAAVAENPAPSDVSTLIDVWLLYRPEGFDSKDATEDAIFKFADESSEAVSKKLKTSRYTAFEIAELKALRKRLNASK